MMRAAGAALEATAAIAMVGAGVPRLHTFVFNLVLTVVVVVGLLAAYEFLLTGRVAW